MTVDMIAALQEILFKHHEGESENSDSISNDEAALSFLDAYHILLRVCLDTSLDKNSLSIEEASILNKVQEQEYVPVLADEDYKGILISLSRDGPFTFDANKLPPMQIFPDQNDVEPLAVPKEGKPKLRFQVRDYINKLNSGSNVSLQGVPLLLLSTGKYVLRLDYCEEDEDVENMGALIMPSRHMPIERVVRALDKCKQDAEDIPPEDLETKQFSRRPHEYLVEALLKPRKTWSSKIGVLAQVFGEDVSKLGRVRKMFYDLLECSYHKVYFLED